MNRGKSIASRPQSGPSYPDVYLPLYFFFQNLSRDVDNLWRIFDLLPIGVMAVNTEGSIIYYNRMHAKLDQLSQQEVLGRPETEVFGFPEAGPGIMRTCQKMRRPILGFRCVYFTQKNPNRLINGAYWVFPLFGADKSLTGSICFTMPISDSDAPEAVKKMVLPRWETQSKKPPRIIGGNKRLVKAMNLARGQADSPSPVLIAGETGTGKELFARLIHDSSQRGRKAFLAVNCSAIPTHLLEGLLFGTTKGSFTGALDKAGIFEQANGGTVYLDEIDSMPLELQPKLLRVIQEMKVRRLGSGREIKLNVKLISSVGLPIEEVLVRQKMRPDLFYRLAVIVINVPPLRERGDDVDELLNYFIAKYNKLLSKKVMGFDAQTRHWLRRYKWPGNVRELENLVAGAINMAEAGCSQLGLEHLPEHYIYQTERESMRRTLLLENGSYGFEQDAPSEDLSYDKGFAYSPQGRPESEKTARPPAEKALKRLNAFERQEAAAIRQQLRLARGKQSLAAEKLGISRQLLHYKMKKYQLSRYEFKPKLGED